MSRHRHSLCKPMSCSLHSLCILWKNINNKIMPMKMRGFPSLSVLFMSPCSANSTVLFKFQSRAKAGDASRNPALYRHGNSIGLPFICPHSLFMAITQSQFCSSVVLGVQHMHHEDTPCCLGSIRCSTPRGDSH